MITFADTLRWLRRILGFSGGSPRDLGTLGKINHVVVLMLENRSFDSMLGQLYTNRPGFDGLTLKETNPDSKMNPVPVWNVGDRATVPQMTIPDPDPGELWVDMNMQLFGPPPPLLNPTGVPAMKGFVQNYESQAGTPSGGINQVMHYFTPDQLPVISKLATSFAVCDQWHASAPCQTWPNRFFAHTGTADGYENNSPPHFPYGMKTIYNLFGDQETWKIYFHELPQSVVLSKLWFHLDRFRLYEEFQNDATNGTLPSYSFIEPRYFADMDLPNDQHPPHVVTLGEQLIADVYNCLRKGRKWKETLLIITYDEHGGNYDHAPPPPATPPSDVATTPFNFDRYGVRVPAVLVSPYIEAGTILKTPGIPFDHTSIIATLCKRFGLDGPLTNRDRVAPTLEGVLNLTEPTNLGPDSIDMPAYKHSQDELEKAKALPLNGLQKSLLHMSSLLPQDPGTLKAHRDGLIPRRHVSKEEFEAFSADAQSDVPGAIAKARNRLGTFFASGR